MSFPQSYLDIPAVWIPPCSPGSCGRSSARAACSPRLAAARRIQTHTGKALPTWAAPAAPCLSSRVQYGLSITPTRLRQVERGEEYLRSLGVTGDLRVRHAGAVARIEVEPSWIAHLEARREAIDAHLRALG